MGLPDMRANRTSDRFAALADTVTCNAKYRFAIGAGKQHLLRPFHTSQPLYIPIKVEQEWNTLRTPYMEADTQYIVSMQYYLYHLTS